MAHQPQPAITPEVDAEATMRDGTVLRADIYRPVGRGPWPVLLARTPYGKQDPGVLARLNPLAATERGYLVVIQDCRGRFRSDGLWQPLTHESADGHDTVRWAARLPGADGQVGMYGPSYLGHAQWAAMTARPAELRAAAPELTWADAHDGLITRGGAFEFGLITHWTLTLGRNVLERRYANRPAELRQGLAELDAALRDLVKRTYWELPAHQPPTVHRLSLPTPSHSPSADRPDGGGADPLPGSGPPVLIVAGWFDCFLQGSLDRYIAARQAGTPARLIVGPWSHGNQTSRIGVTDFGAIADAANIDGAGSLFSRELDWFDRHLKPDSDAGAAGVGPSESAPPALVFVMGSNEWRSFPTWPPETHEASWYLHGDGRLSHDAPGAVSPPTAFRHDPSSPVPTHGGAILMAPEFPAGPLDQREVELRGDVLVYTSPPLTAPLEVIGRVKAHLVADSTAPTTDWVARLCDVDTDGVSRNIADGILRTWDNGAGGAERSPNEHLIDLWSTAHVFLPGHRIRLQITSSCFPRWDRNLGAALRGSGGDPGGTSGQPQAPVARQRVYHDVVRPSRLVLPVLRRAATDTAAASDGRAGLGRTGAGSVAWW